METSWKDGQLFFIFALYEKRHNRATLTRDYGAETNSNLKFLIHQVNTIYGEAIKGKKQEIKRWEIFL